MIFIFLAILGAIMNWFIRGGGWKAAIYHNQNVPNIISGDIPNALVFGGCAWYLSNSPLAGVFFALGMYAGSAPGWGAYIKAMIDGRKLWGLGRMTLRGILWGAAVCLAAGLSSIWTPISVWFFPAILLAGSLLGVIFYSMIRIFGVSGGNYVFNMWTCSEMLFGGIFWSSMILVK